MTCPRNIYIYIYIHICNNQHIKELIKYCIIGCTGAGLDAVLFYLLTSFCGIHYQIANFLSVTCGILNNFVLNAYFNFKMTDRLWRRFVSFYLIGMLGWALSAALLWLFIEKMQMKPIIAKFVIIFIVTLVQFTLNKLVTFARKHPAEIPAESAQNGEERK